MKAKIKTVVLVLIVFCFLSIFIKKAQAQTCSCSEMVEGLVSKTESNYAGYIHKVKEKDSSKYVKLKADIRKEASNTSFTDCYDLLDRFVSYFKDGHLFVFESPKSLSHAMQDSMAKQLARYSSTLEKEIKQLRSNDPIVGIWQNADYKLGIIKKSNAYYEAVVLDSKIDKWKPGMIKMEIAKDRQQGYNITLYRNDFAKIHFNRVHIYKDVFLPFGVYRFVRVAPELPELNYVNTNNPQLPVIKSVNKDNIVLTIPSALINGTYLDSLLLHYEKEISVAQNFIVDIRGNLGGNFIWGKLYDIANTVIKPKQVDPNNDYFLMLASKDNAAYFANYGNYYKQVKDTGGIQFYDSLENTIKNNIGAVIKFSFYNPNPDTATRTVQPFPKNIAIITDKGVASAAEAFVLWMKENSSRVTLYGDNTYGMIDYQNINMVHFGCKENATYYFGYPTFFSKDIKTNPLNPTGIKPDVYIPKRTPDAVKWVINDLKRNN